MGLFILPSLLFINYATFIYLIMSIYLWYCDLVLSLYRKQSVVYPFLFIAILLFVGSEALLFIAFLWGIFSYLFVSHYNNLIFADPVELTFSNSILLSIAASCLCVYSLNGNVFINLYYLFLAFIMGLLFLNLQINEYQLLGFYITDSFYSSTFYFVTALHFSHVIIGIILLGLKFISLYNIQLLYLNIQLFYWHFVEIIWLVLYLIFYSSFMAVWFARALSTNHCTPYHILTYTPTSIH